MKIPKVIGTDRTVTLATGKKALVVHLNNAATTPPFEQTLQEVNDFLQTYSSLNRGAGPHATATYNKVQEAISGIRKFLNTREDQALLFTQNTTSAINLFARTLRLSKQDVVITSPIEHTSNNLPWHFNTAARIVEVNAFDDSSIDYDDLERKAEEHSRYLRWIALNGASNTTGCIPDLQRLSRIAREHNTLLFIDAAQLASCRAIDMKRDGIDALAFSAHKVYSPFGTGALVLPKAMLETTPVDPGGGTVDMVGENDVLWVTSEEQRHQAGTWNAVGIIALAASCKTMSSAREAIVQHERSVVEYAAWKLSAVDKLTLYIQPEKYLNENRAGIFPFNLDGYHHALLSAILEHEYGIETRAGTICNHRLIRRWFNVSESEQKRIEAEISNGNRLASYGIVRASLGIHNTREDIDLLVSALSDIAKNGPRLKYKEVPKDGIFVQAV